MSIISHWNICAILNQVKHLVFQFILLLYPWLRITKVQWGLLKLYMFSHGIYQAVNTYFGKFLNLDFKLLLWYVELVGQE